MEMKPRFLLLPVLIGGFLAARAASDPNHATANYIKLSVDPTGKSYTISIPATGHQRTFQARLDKP